MKRQLFLTLCVFCATMAPAWAVDKSLVLYLPFDEGAGNVTKDASSYGNDGSIVGDAAWVEGYKGTALEFVTGSHVTIPEIPEYDISAEVSLMAWVNATTNPNWGRVIDKSQYQTSGFDLVLTQNVGLARLEFFVANTTSIVDSTTVVMDGEWHFIAGTFGAATLRAYVDGVLEGEATSVNQVDINPNDLPVMIAGETSSNGGQQYFGSIDEVAMYNRELSEDEIADIFVNGMALAEFAGSPQPQGGAVDVPQDTVLNWAPGGFAAAHDVYFGTSMEDVNTADRANPMGVLVSQGQSGTTYDPEGLLEFGQTYYWRIDEVNAAPDNTIFKGDLWSFTVEPYVYPIESIIATSNGTSEPDSGPEKTVDGSGLNANGEHSTSNTDMWAATTGGAAPVYIQYEFDRTYKLYELQVWNYNSIFEPLLGFGFKDVTIEYSEDGEAWTLLKNVQFAQGTARATYTANTIVDLEGTAAKYVRLIADSGYGATGSYGLSEVRFLYLPVQARDPQPTDGATDVAVETMLDWRAGRQAASHDVYLGTDAEALALADTVTTSDYDPGILDLSMTYYWRVDEVNDTTGTWEGSLWSFTTQPFLVVDDFESYTDDEGQRIYEFWEDGFVNDTGSTVGYLEAPFAERTIVHSGRQSMPLFYDNVGGISVSEADLALSPAQNWTQAGVTTFTLYFHGDLENDAADVYVKINGTKIAGGGSTDMALWKQWNIDLASAGVNVQNVTSITVGIEGTGAGVIYVDDLRLYREPPQIVAPTDPGTDSLALHYTFENNVDDVSGHGYDGTPMNDPFYADAVDDLGRAMSFDGINDYVEMPIGSLLGSLSDITIATWVNMADSTISWQRILDCGTSSSEGYMFLCPRTGTAGPVRFAITPDGGGNESYIDASSTLSAGWHHVVATIDSATMTMTIYIDGALAASGPTGTLPRDLGTPTQNWLGRSQYDADGYLKALVADLSLYDRALTLGEVRYLAGDR